MCATSSPGRRMSGGILRGRKCRRLKVARKSTSLAMAPARIGTSLACAWSATLWTRDGEGGGTMVTAAFRINRNGGAAAGNFAKRFRSASFTTYWEVRHVRRVNSASRSRMWLAPVVEAAPAIRTSASQKMRTCRAAFKSTLPAPLSTAAFRSAKGSRR